jgi:hypothetical protein
VIRDQPLAVPAVLNLRQGTRGDWKSLRIQGDKPRQTRMRRIISI